MIVWSLKNYAKNEHISKKLTTTTQITKKKTLLLNEKKMILKFVDQMDIFYKLR